MRPPALPQSRPQAVSSPLRQLPRDLLEKPVPKPEPPKPAAGAAHAQFDYTTATTFEDQESQLSESLEFFAPSDDEAMMAAADLASGVGGPIYDEDSTFEAEPSIVEVDKGSTSAAPLPQGKPGLEAQTAQGRSSRSNAIAAALAAMEKDTPAPGSDTSAGAARPAVLGPSHQPLERPTVASLAAAVQHPRPVEAANPARASISKSPAPTSSSMGGGFNLPPGFVSSTLVALPVMT
jgi:hypothetical protein